MTATQAAFAFFLLVVAPSSGVCGAVLCRGTKLGAFRGLVLGTAASWASLAFAGLVAALVHPRYPREGPPEHTAMLFLVPAYLLGIGAVVALSRRARRDAPERSARPGLTLLAIGTAASVLVVAALYVVLVPPFHKALPWGARDVRESHRADGFLSDYACCLKARVSPEQFAGYVARFGLTPHTESRVYTDDKLWLTWSQPQDRSDSAWWNPPAIEAGRTYVAQAGDEWVLAAYKDGWVYVSGGSH